MKIGQIHWLRALMDLSNKVNDCLSGRRRYRNHRNIFSAEKLEPRHLLAGESILISEFMASNSDTLRDDFREYTDWVELHNPTAAEVSVENWYLTDDAENLSKWQIPAATIPADGYLVIFASGRDQANPDDELHTNFKLSSGGEFLGLVRPDNSVSHSYDPSYPSQNADISYGLVFTEAGAQVDQASYFQTATPAERNGEPDAQGFTSQVTFSTERGYFDAPFEVTLETETPNSTIRYTTDGSAPTADSGEVYTGPVTINTTTTLRAAAFAENLITKSVGTNTYIFLDDVLQQTGEGLPEQWGHFDDQGNTRLRTHSNYEVDPDIVNHEDYKDTIKDDLRSLPTISLVLDPDDLFEFENGIYSNPMSKGDRWERAVSLEIIDIDGELDLQADAGVRIHGGWARRPSQTLKHSFRVNFKTEYGEPLFEFPLFGEDGQQAYQSIVFRGGFNDSWRNSGNSDNTYMQDQWARMTQLEMGGFTSRHRYAHLYLNGLYWGMYSPTERMNAEWASAYMGGNVEDWDVINTGGNVVDGSSRAFTELGRSIRSLTRDEITYDDMKEIVDVPGFIDYLIVNQYIGNWDWPHNNWYASYSRAEGGKWRFHTWDAEAAFQRGIAENRVSGDIRAEVGPSNLYLALREVPEFQKEFADRVAKHFTGNGQLTIDANIDRLNRIASDIDRAIVGESARWGDGKDNQGRPITRESWVRRIEAINKSYFPRRGDRVLDQYRNASLYAPIDPPEFNQYGGNVTSDFDIKLTTELIDGEIFYTTDGSDPEGVNGTASPNAIRLNAFDLLNGESAAKILIPTGDANEADWQKVAYNDAAWTDGVASVGYDTEIIDDAISVPGGFTVREVIAESRPRIETLEDADKVLGGENLVSEETFNNIPFIDYLGGSRGGHFDSNSPFPNGSNNFVIDATGKMMVSKAGVYTLGATVNDAVRIEVDGQVVFADTERHSTADRFATVNLTEGEHDVRVVMFDRLGTAVLEFYYAPGEKTEFDEDFQLVGDIKDRRYTDVIGTDLKDAMLGVNSSAYVRIPFTHSSDNQIESLLLKQNYDDGLVAYLNGTQILSRNAPEVLDHNSAATKPRQDSLAIASELIDLSEFKDLLVDGDNLLAIHALNIESQDNDFYIKPELFGTIADAAINLDDSATIKAKVSQNGLWSAMVQADFSLAVPATSDNVRISEIHYHPRPSNEAEIAAGFDSPDDFEFIEVVNIGSESINISELSLSLSTIDGNEQGVSFAFADGAVSELAPGGYAVIVEDLAAFQHRYGTDLPVAGQWSGGLSNSTETITLSVGEQTIQQFAYNDDWFPATDGAGSSLELIDPVATPLDQWGAKASWRASQQVDGTPGGFVGDVIGDANRDGVFNSADLVVVFQAGEYQDGIENNSTWEEGDWNGDGDFTSRDIVAAFILGSFDNGAKVQSIFSNDDRMLRGQIEGSDLDRGELEENSAAARDLAFEDWV